MALLALTTLERVKEALTLTETGEQDDVLDGLILAVSAEVEQFLSRPLSLEERTEQYDVRRFQNRFYLRAYPVTEIAEVHYDLERDFEADDLIDADDYYCEMRTGTLRIDDQMEEGDGVLRVKYTAGLAEDTDDFIAAYPHIESWVVRQIRHEFNRRTQPGAQSTTLPQGGTSWTGQLKMLDGLIAVLKPMRAPRIV